MPYNHTRKVTNNNNNGNSRSVSYGQGGLNERFSQLAQRSTLQHVNNNNNNNNSNNSNTSKAKSSTASVFSRLRGAKQDTPRARAKSIQSRLGKTVNGGVQKRGAKASVKGTATGRVDKRTNASLKKGVKAQQQNKKNGAQDKKKQQQQKKKPLTAEELDRAMDAYMMKDPKTAQAKLDAEITSYMDEANDLLMDEPL
ncbi:hypothetical protein A0J61_01149 [Choanephora cucurbitarum]|uniref:Chromatin target of PRMT1 protein C-terminal domain-containing protein n=1 Tax=Choanephora cucurbitarum TaxID=101091 RepID=A0A1C7NQX0_9FUNG|nr:hypothetical protein A0J61_01149 [Choanephora cucurbitarum]